MLCYAMLCGIHEAPQCHYYLISVVQLQQEHTRLYLAPSSFQIARVHILHRDIH